MITLSIRQPWAWLIVRPDITDLTERVEAYRTRKIKDIENRSWRTPHRGPFLIHAGKAFDIKDLSGFAHEMKEEFGIICPKPEEYQRGGIIGMADITGCVTESDSPWFFGEFGFQLANAKPLPFLPCPGKLSFFETDYRLPVPEAK